jgi:PEP-CTERM motif-containing protein
VRLSPAFLFLAFPALSATIHLNPGSGLSGNTTALAAFTRAADAWSRFLSDPVTIEIDADLANLGNSSIVGQSSSVLLGTAYTGLRQQLLQDSADESDDAIVAALPTAAQFSAYVPSGATLSPNVVLTKANAKALGYTGLDLGSDGSIVFNSLFNFDYDNSNGVVGMDFESVAMHEIGHTLGFISAVDTLDYYGPLMVSIFPLDLYRFSDGNLPANVADFTTTPRELRPGQKASTSDTHNVWGMSTGVTRGDGRQASHWKDGVLTGTIIGSMNPTIGLGQKFSLTSADLRAMDLIGWDVQTVPEPGTTSLLAVGLAGIWWLRRRRVA